jgi:ubiquinol-cytochrome c reductase cytochrome b subunit
MEKKGSDKKIVERLNALYNWVISRLERTLLMGVRFVIPKKLLSPHGFLGMLTFITFIILGVTGALLMFYYKPSLANAYGSVEIINNEVPFGLIIRNIHYHASNAMIFLAVYHMFYQFFAGRYKIRNEIIWVTGVILGVLTIIEAYTGYDLIMNERAVLAINIGASLTNSIPVIGQVLANILIGSGFSDILIRFYAFHVFIIPLLMLLLVTIHFPRNLVLDLPMVAIISGAILVVGGLSPVSLGTKFDPNIPPGITVPEWYLTGLYAFIRTGIDKFLAGVLLPTALIVLFLIMPFIDRSRKLSWRERPFVSGLGIAGLGQIVVTTVWGFYINPDPTLDLSKRIMIDPLPFYATLIAITIAAFGFTYGYTRWMPPKKNAERIRGGQTNRRLNLKLSGNKLLASLIGLIGMQLTADIMGVNSYTSGYPDIAMIWIGASIIIFAVILHILRTGLEMEHER